jgi:D-lactate dehydrogenase
MSEIREPMSVAVFSTKEYDELHLTEANRAYGHDLRFFGEGLNPRTAVLAAGCEAVCAFVNDDIGAETIDALADRGVRLVALRSAGFNHVDLAAAGRRGLAVVRVPEYSPHAVAEHCVGLILALNRKIYRAHNRVREGNFSLVGLLGFDLYGKTVGIIGTGTIGTRFAEIITGFGTEVIAADPYPNDRCLEIGVAYHPIDEVLARSDIVSLHCPLMPETYHLINEDRLSEMKDGVMVINTSRGALIDTAAVIEALKTGKIGNLGLDVYEEEAHLFFEDLSDHVLQDDIFSRLLTFPNVLITGHQAFFTAEALDEIAETTMMNISEFAHGSTLTNALGVNA